jgi:hypothetical protein
MKQLAAQPRSSVFPFPGLERFLLHGFTGFGFAVAWVITRYLPQYGRHSCNFSSALASLQ